MDRTMLLARLKRRLGVSDTSQDELFLEVIEEAIEYIKEYCNNTFIVNEVELIPPTLKGTIVDIAVFKNKRLDGKLIGSESIGDYSVQYIENSVEDIPQTVKNVLNRYKLMRVW